MSLFSVSSGWTRLHQGSPVAVLREHRAGGWVLQFLRPSSLSGLVSFLPTIRVVRMFTTISYLNTLCFHVCQTHMNKCSAALPTMGWRRASKKMNPRVSWAAASLLCLVLVLLYHHCEEQRLTIKPPSIFSWITGLLQPIQQAIVHGKIPHM